MALDKQLISIPMGGGIDTRSDAKTIGPGKLALLTNGVFTTPSSVRKRYGGSQLASQEWSINGAAGIAMTGGRLLATLNDELLLGDKDALLSYANGYFNHRGYLTPFQVRTQALHPQPRVYNNDCASTGSFTVHAWEDTQAAGAGIRVQARDDTTDAVVFTGLLTSANAVSRPAVVAVGSTIHIYYVELAVNTLRLFTLIRNGSSVTTTTATVCTDLHGTVPAFDVRLASTQVLVVYNSSTATTVKHGYVSEAGSVGAFTSQSTAAAVSALGCAVDSSTLAYAVFWAMNSSTTITAGFFNSNASQLLAPTAIGAAYPATVVFITGAIVSGSPSKLHVLATYDQGATPPITYHASLTSAGTAVNGVRWFRQSSLLSHAWVHNSYVFATIMGCLATEDLSRQNAFVARCGDSPDESPGITPDSTATASPNTPRTWDRYIAAGGFLPSASVRGESWFTLAHVTTLTGPKYRMALPYAADNSGGLAIRLIDLETTTVVPFLQSGQCAYMPSAQGLTQYDGRYVTETGFWMFPPAPTSSLGAGGNLDASAVYGYRWYYEWFNAKGERERSSAAEVTVTTTANNKPTFTIRPLVMTNKTCELGVSDVAIVGYRTLGGETDAYYRVTSTNPGSASGDNCYIRNDATSETISWTDNMSDATAATHEQDYLSAGELDEVSPAACRVIAAGNGRVYVAGMDDPNLVRYSKTRGTGEALAFNEALEIVLDAGTGPITALGFLTDSLVIFRDSQTFAITGDGFDNTGTGSTLGAVRQISDVIGCINQRSLCNVPQGLIFQSRKGIYLLTHGGEFEYIGADIESYNAQTVYSATAMPDSEEVRFTMSGGTTLLWDYAAGQWANWTIGGLDSVIWRNSYVRLVDSTGSIYQEGTSFIDGATTFSMVTQTPWLNLGQLQGAKLAYSLYVLGQYMSGHKIQVKVYYDYESSASYTHTWDATSIVTGSAIYQFEVPLTRTLCEAVKFELEDIVDGVATPLRESYRLTELMLEVGFKNQPKRNPVDRRATY